MDKRFHVAWRMKGCVLRINSEMPLYISKKTWYNAFGLWKNLTKPPKRSSLVLQKKIIIQMTRPTKGQDRRNRGRGKSRSRGRQGWGEVENRRLLPVQSVNRQQGTRWQ
jgi:hypothetical protein